MTRPTPPPSRTSTVDRPGVPGRPRYLTLERLRVVTPPKGVGFDLRTDEGEGPVIATLFPAAHVVILDAIRRHDGRGSRVVTTEFDVALQRGRVVRWALGGGTGPVARVLFEGPPGSVLWWLRERDGGLEVRDVRHGCTHPIDEDAVVLPDADGDRGRRPA